VWLVFFGVVAAPGCGRVVLGKLPGDAGPAVPKPAQVDAWEPPSADPNARITVVTVGERHTYVGFSNGEIHARANAGGSPWQRLDSEQDGMAGPRTPRRPVTSILVNPYPGEDPPTLFVGYAGHSSGGTSSESTLYVILRHGEARFIGSMVSDVWSISSSPFDPVQLVMVTANAVWATLNRGSTWNGSGSGTFPIGIAVTVGAFAVGTGPTGARRAWIGTARGDIFYADDIDAAPSSSLAWTLARVAESPEHSVTSIAVNRLRPQEVWVTLAGLRNDNVWASTDNGVTWTNHHTGDLPVSQTVVPAAALTSISLVPELDFAYLTVIAPDPTGSAAVSTFWRSGPPGSSGSWHAH
jgi:hypothetical protein